MTKKDKQSKGRVVEIPDDFNRMLKIRVLELEELGVKTSVPELLIKLARIGFKYEAK
jgi:hypothetical protein